MKVLLISSSRADFGILKNLCKVLKKDKIPTPENEEKFIDSISEIIKENISNISKVSIAMPGFVNFEKKQYSYGPNLQYDINFSKLVNFTDYEFYLDNDGNVAAYCEYF